MDEHSIPPELVINFDDIALPLFPMSEWTVTTVGSTQVPLVALDDKRQITGVLACSMAGNPLPSQLIYEGT